ncbi:hypothetical protein FG379_003203 [Cryptosporidium bovis]|uniref:uncharacterized protein n=1 Tax=Cryptosporidium bovis TaxID=310047 RepID=UPI00351A2AA9|nr:hypothetical protein FG379_003203 [Cryptosporidium bovis]
MTSIFKYSLNRNLDHLNALANLINNLKPLTLSNCDSSVNIYVEDGYLDNLCEGDIVNEEEIGGKFKSEKMKYNDINDVGLMKKNIVNKNKIVLDWNMKILKTISELCPSIFSKAISLLDNGMINIFVEINTNRRFYIVENKNKNKTREISYIVMRHFCSCRSYIDKVVIQKSDFTCKHELACSIIDAIYIPNINNKKSNASNFSILNNKLIKVIILNEYDYSEKYLNYISDFFIDNGTFKSYF